MKRGLLLLSLLIAITLISIHSASAFSIGDLVQSEWANAALVFLLVFNVVLMAMRDVFKRSYGAAVIIAMVIALAGSIGVVYYFGAFLSKIGLWLLILFIVVIALLVTRFAKGKGIIVFIVLGAGALFWLAFGHKWLCPPLGQLPFNVCQILDVLSMIILIACFLRLLFWLFKRFGKGGDGGGGGGPGGSGGGRDGGGDEDLGGEGHLRGHVKDQHNAGIEAEITIVGRGFTSQTIPTDPSGFYDIPLPGGRGKWLKRTIFRKIKSYAYNVTAHKQGYSSQTKRPTIFAGRATKCDFKIIGSDALIHNVAGGLLISVVDEHNMPIQGADVGIQITTHRIPMINGKTDGNGKWHTPLPGAQIRSIKGLIQRRNLLAQHKYAVMVAKAGYSHVTPQPQTVTIIAGQDHTLHFVLKQGGLPPPGVGPKIKLYIKYQNQPLAKKIKIPRGERVKLVWATRNAEEIEIPGIIHSRNPAEVKREGRDTPPLNNRLNVFTAYARKGTQEVQDRVEIETDTTTGPAGTHKLQVEMYVGGAVNRGAGEIRIKPGTYPYVKSPNVPFVVVKENPGFKFEKWMIHNLNTGASLTNTNRTFTRPMDADYRVEAHFSKGTGPSRTKNKGNSVLSASTQDLHFAPNEDKKSITIANVGPENSELDYVVLSKQGWINIVRNHQGTIGGRHFAEVVIEIRRNMIKDYPANGVISINKKSGRGVIVCKIVVEGQSNRKKEETKRALHDKFQREWNNLQRQYEHEWNEYQRKVKSGKYKGQKFKPGIPAAGSLENNRRKQIFQEMKKIEGEARSKGIKISTK